MKRIFFLSKVGGLAVCALALTGCDGRNEAPGSKVEVAVTSSVTSSEKTPVIAKTEPHMRKVVRPEPSASAYAGWHDDIVSGCAESQSVQGGGVQVRHFDVNGDGMPDKVCWQAVRDAAYGDFVQVMAHVERLNGDKESAYIILAANDGPQAALCNAGSVSVKQTLWARGQVKNVDGGFNGPIAITLTDSRCGPVSLFWPRDAGVEEARFTLLRI